MKIFLRSIAGAGICTVAMGCLAAPPAAPRAAAQQAAEAEPVMTRARLQTFDKAPDGRFYARLRLMPRSKIPFTTQIFRVTDPSLLIDVPVGSTVKFTSKHIDGENTVTSVRAVAPCVRFQNCD